MPAALVMRRASAGELDESLGSDSRTENGHIWNFSTDHCDFVAAVEAWAALAILIDFVGQCGAVFDDAKAVAEEEVGDAGEEADRIHAVVFGLFDQGIEEHAARTLTLALWVDDNRTDLGEVRPVEVQRAAADEVAFVG